MKLFCFGLGYSAAALVQRLSSQELSIAATRTRLEAAVETIAGHDVALAAYAGDQPSASARKLLEGATHVLVSIPPDLEGDPVVRHFATDFDAFPDLAWIGYLSTIGVYGDAQGGWVDETSPTRPISERSLRRLKAEQQWQDFAVRMGKRVEIFRLAGIYGPGRSVVDNLKSGTARRIVKPDQVFNRIHVDDIAEVLFAAMTGPAKHQIYNVTDDEPAPPQDVIAYAAEILRLPVPPEISFESAKLTPMGASFYAENKRVRNGRMKFSLSINLRYPTYREGILALADPH